MAGRETADIVFCMDASGSMSNAFEGVKQNVMRLVKSMEASLQQKWDIRFDFLAYSNRNENEMRLQTVKCNGLEVLSQVYNSPIIDANNGLIQTNLFTKDIKEFERALGRIETKNDESTGLALDICADFPFRDSSTCHRVVILLTDEAVSTGVYPIKTQRMIMDIAKKYQDKKISLFMVTPNCDVYDSLSQIDKCEWTIDNSEGLQNIDFSKLLERIGKSVSMSQNSISSNNEIHPLFNESKWTSSGENDYVDVSF